MPLLLDTARFGSAMDFRAANCVTIGLINNMPDAAVESTERQFIDLIRAATTSVVVRLLLFMIPEVPRAEKTRQDLAERYRDVSKLWDTHLDGLIVTGTEPRAAALKDEPYWSALTKVVDWARDNTSSTIWSCLAAHAAVLHTDGIERRLLKDKLLGVFDCETVAGHPMLKGAESRLRVPHSRHNDLPESALTSCGYAIFTRSAAAGVDMFASEANSFFLFMQGHPEYEADTLLREYRRDIARFLSGEREQYPGMPQGLFDDDAATILGAFRERGLAYRRNSLIAEFPMDSLEVGLESSWRRSAVAIYENWLDYLKERKADRQMLADPLRRAWRDSRPTVDTSTR
jgi:homoserine O-succinyltransferase/O-acetyltransferase